MPSSADSRLIFSAFALSPRSTLNLFLTSDHISKPVPCFSEEMRPVPRPTVSVPSVSVLHVLRSQSEPACSFTPSTRAIACSTSPCRGAKVAQRTVARILPSIRRNVATSSPRQASVESSFLNLDFLRPYSERGPARSYPLASRSPQAHFGFLGETRNASRYASTDSRPLWERPWNWKLRKEKQALKTPSFLDDVGNTSFGRRKIVKGANELRLRCTEFDENGNVTFMDGEFKKSELIAKVCAINVWPENERLTLTHCAVRSSPS